MFGIILSFSNEATTSPPLWRRKNVWTCYGPGIAGMTCARQAHCMTEARQAHCMTAARQAHCMTEARQAHEPLGKYLVGPL